MKILSVVGARPQFVKLAAVAAAAAETPGVDHLILHTGQHYDPTMSDVFFADLRIPEPDINLGVGSGTHGAQTAAMITGIERVLFELKPDWTVVYGDTNSTLAATIAAVKLERPVAHVEAGLRSFNRRMPEEHNRVMTDHASDMLLAPTEGAMMHLRREGLAGRALLVGDVMADVCLRVSESVRGTPPPRELERLHGSPYVVATLHRAENTDDSGRLRLLLERLSACLVPVVLFAHPRLVARAEAFEIPLQIGALVPVDPVPYPVLIRAVLGSAGVVTDSGGLQKEAFLLQRPCTTVRSETEWPETLTAGWNVLDPDLAHPEVSVVREAPNSDQGKPYGDGRAAQRILRALTQ